MKIKQMKNLSILSASMLFASSFLPLFTYGESNIKDSIGSINMEDNGVTIGVDETQSQKTTYSNEIEEEGTQGSDVYVSQASTFGVTIPKTIILDGKKNDDGINKANYIVTINNESNFGGEETINVIPEETFLLSQLGKENIQANVVQDKQRWKYNELDIIGNGEVSTNEMSAGSWKGIFYFNIELDSSFIKVEAFDENRNNLNATSKEIKGKEKEQLLNALEESNLINSKNEVDLLIDIKTNEFENMATTTFDVSDIANENDKVVVLHFDETRQEWEYISTETVNSEGKITTNMSSFSPVAFVKVNDDGSFSEHEHIYNNGIITQENNCTQNKIKTYTCYCGHSYEEIVIFAIGHKYGNITYSWSGYTTCVGKRTCSICGYIESINANITSSIITAATCTTTGTKKYVATFNNSDYVTQSKTETLAAGHNMVAGECSRCDYNVPGLYNSSGNLICNWNSSGIKVDIAYENGSTSTTRAKNVIDNKYPKTTKIILPNNITTIGELSLAGCTTLTSIVIPNSVTSIGKQSFNNCESLINIDIPNSVTTISSHVFWNCYSLETVKIGSGVKSIGDASFLNCKKLTKIDVNSSNANFSSSNGILFSKDKKKLLIYPAAKTGTYTIPSTVTRVGIYAFAFSQLNQITIPSNVTYIEQQVFINCDNLTEITIPNNITNIYYRTFGNCTNLKNVTIGSGVTNISYNVFQNCDNLEKVTFKDTTTWYIGTSSGATTTKVTVTNTTTNATYFKSTYTSKYWTKK